MSSTSIILPLPQRGHNRWFRYEDGLATVTYDENDDLRVDWNLTDYLASGETVSSASYTDSGVTTSSRSVLTPSIIFTITKRGWTKVIATLSTGRNVTQKFYVLSPDNGGWPNDYA